MYIKQFLLYDSMMILSTLLWAFVFPIQCIIYHPVPSTFLYCCILPSIISYMPNEERWGTSDNWGQCIMYTARLVTISTLSEDTLKGHETILLYGRFLACEFTRKMFFSWRYMYYFGMNRWPGWMRVFNIIFSSPCA